MGEKDLGNIHYPVPLSGIRTIEESSTRVNEAKFIAQIALAQTGSVSSLLPVKSDNRSFVWQTEDRGIFVKVFTDHMDGRGRYQRDLWGSLTNCFTEDNIAAFDDVLRVIASNNRTEGLMRVDQLLNTITSQEEFQSVAGNLARGFSKIHQQQFSEFGWLVSPEPLREKDYDVVRDFPITSYDGDSYYEFEMQRMSKLSGVLEKIWPAVDLNRFNAMRESIDQEEYVRNNGDYNPWNIFTDPKTGEVKQVIDWEWSLSAPRGRDVANTMLYLTMYSRWCPALRENLENTLSTFLSEYEVSAGIIDKEKFRQTLPLYFTAAGLWNTWFHYFFEGKDTLANINMELATVFSQADEFDINKVVANVNKTSLYLRDNDPRS